MSHPAFITKYNLTTMWDIICDQPIFQTLSNQNQEHLRAVFYNHSSIFYEKEKTQEHTLVSLNKKYMLIFMKHMKQLSPTTQSSRKIKIHDEPLNRSMVTIEEIQNEKLAEFEHGVEAQRKDLETYMTPQRPPIPQFADPKEDTSLDIEEELRKITAQRKYDGQQMQDISTATAKVTTTVNEEKKVTWGENTDIYTTKELHQKIAHLETQVQELQDKIERLLS